SEALGKKFINKNGINFNLINRTPLVHKESFSRDTLSLDDIKKFAITEEKDIGKKVKNWRLRYNKIQREKLESKYDEYYVPVSNRNFMFQTYLIEKISNEKVVVYEVQFRNEGVIH
ncbi:hypothetical protein, partial [Longispora fulva]|uniref:hypothetical protein n=2 Tax=Bacteria TaxID=2 RepID=UPI00363CD190